MFLIWCYHVLSIELVIISSIIMLIFSWEIVKFTLFWLKWCRSHKFLSGSLEDCLVMSVYYHHISCAKRYHSSSALLFLICDVLPSICGCSTWDYHLPLCPLGVNVSSRVIHDSSGDLLFLAAFFVLNGDGIVNYGMIVRSVVYSYWMAFLCSNKDSHVLCICYSKYWIFPQHIECYIHYIS